MYPDFDPNVHYISKDNLPQIIHYFAGVDFGWEHTGCIVLCGEDKDANLYLIREWSAKHRGIDAWIRIVREEIETITGRLPLYCDSARPDLISEMAGAGLDARLAHKDVIAGISEIATRFKTRKLFIVKDNVDLFKQEIESYIWKEDEDAPVKENDDVMDALRYAIYSDKIERLEGSSLVLDPEFLNVMI